MVSRHAASAFFNSTKCSTSFTINSFCSGLLSATNSASATTGYSENAFLMFFFAVFAFAAALAFAAYARTYPMQDNYRAA